MAATYTLGTTTFLAPVGKSDSQVKVASTSGLTAGSRLYAERELMQVVSLDVSTLVNVRRGIDGTSAERHGTDATVYTGDPDWFYSFDPVGQPRSDLRVTPHINIRTGEIWFAQGDSSESGQRWWQKQSVGHDTGPLGATTKVLDPTSST